MTFGAPFGAEHRLLPETIPIRFFGVAVSAHALAWLSLAIVADDLPGFAGGPGPVLAAVHLLTLGVLLPTAMGASMQMLPVALARPAPPAAACNGVFWTSVPGAGALVVGFAVPDKTLIAAGATAVALGVVVYVLTVGRVIAGARGLGWIVAHVWVALAALAAATALALALGFGEVGRADPARAALVHAVLGGYGYLGFLVLGLSHILVPMFAMAEPPPAAEAAVAFGIASLALALGAVGALGGVPAASLAAIAAGAVACALHLRSMIRAVARRMRRRLGPEFVLFGASWALAPLGLALAAAAALDGDADGTAAAFVFVVLYGWLLSMLVGVLQRIMPFLASMHAMRKAKMPVSPAELTATRPLAIHRWCHLAAVSMVGLGIVAEAPLPITLGGAVGFAGALAFGTFAVIVARRTRARLAAADPTAETE